uniref:COesterase domain-containing protein n=1 Tax=Parastrongyloides trichosuri TaxID=131310 RepID=A0A0N4Z8B6_PARTI
MYFHNYLHTVLLIAMKNTGRLKNISLEAMEAMFLFINDKMTDKIWKPYTENMKNQFWFDPDFVVLGVEPSIPVSSTDCDKYSQIIAKYKK